MYLQEPRIGFRLSRGWILATVSSLLVVMAGGSGRATTNQETGLQSHADEVLVREVGLMIDSRNLMSKKDEASLETSEFSVLEDGSVRRVTQLVNVSDLPGRPKAESADSEDAGPWHIVIYIDRRLSRPSSLVAAIHGIASRTAELKDLGAMTVVLADPAPRILLERSQAPRHVAKVLLDIAEEVPLDRDEDPLRMDTPTSRRDQPSTTEVRLQWDRLATFMSDRSHDGPRALLLLEDGFLLSPDEVLALSGRATAHLVGQPAHNLANVVMDTAQLLSSYGWVTIPVALGHEPPERQEPWVDEFAEFRDDAQLRFGSRERRTTINFFGTTRPGRPSAALDDRLYEAYSLPRLAPLRALSEATGGALAWHEGQLETALEHLTDRWLLRFQTPEPHDGRIRRIEVVHRGTSKHFTAPWWSRSSTPYLLAESRLRLILAGEELGTAHLPLTAEVDPESIDWDERGLQQVDLRLEIPTLTLNDEVAVGHFRFSVAQLDLESGVVFQHTADIQAPTLGEKWTYVLPATLSVEGGPLAIAVDDLSRGHRGVVLLNLAEVRDAR